MVTCTITPCRAAVRLNSGVRPLKEAPMKLKILLGSVVVLLLSQPCFAQKTTGDIIAENFERGRRMREAIDARRAQQETAAAPEAAVPAPPKDQPSKLPVGAFIFFLNNSNGVPRIVVTAFTPTRCGKPWKMAATLDKNGESETGCFKADEDKGTFTVDWNNYGVRTYSLSEWRAELPADADHKALGE